MSMMTMVTPDDDDDDNDGVTGADTLCSVTAVARNLFLLLMLPFVGAFAAAAGDSGSARGAP